MVLHVSMPAVNIAMPTFRCLCFESKHFSADSEKAKTGKIAELFVYDNFNRVPAERVEAGDICAFTGLGDVGIGETVCARDSPKALPTIEVCFLLSK